MESKKKQLFNVLLTLRLIINDSIVRDVWWERQSVREWGEQGELQFEYLLWEGETHPINIVDLGIYVDLECEFVVGPKLGKVLGVCGFILIVVLISEELLLSARVVPSAQTILSTVDKGTSTANPSSQPICFEQ